jgi:hypothetical protein
VIRDGDNGVLADFFSPSDIADKVIAALEFPAEHMTARTRARQTVIDRYDLGSVCLPAQLKMLTSCIDAHRF